MPPRLVAIREDGKSLTVVGEQAEAARLLDAAYAETVAQGQHHHRPTLDEVQDTLSHLSEALSGLTHWDIRPARTVSLLSSLSEFLDPDGPNDDGHHLFGQLTLPCLEKLAEVWASILDPAWITAKQGISSRSKTGQEIPDYLGIEPIFRCFINEPEDIVAAAHDQMEELLKRFQTASNGQIISILDRLAIIFRVENSE